MLLYSSTLVNHRGGAVTSRLPCPCCVEYCGVGSIVLVVRDVVLARTHIIVDTVVIVMVMSLLLLAPTTELSLLLLLVL